MQASRDFLIRQGLPGGDTAPAPSSKLRFPDGAEYRIEIPSTESPRAFEAVLEEAAKHKVPVHRVSQGSGIMLMTDEEITAMAQIGQREKIEVNLFVGPRATFDIGAQAFSPAGKTLGLSLRGADQLAFALEDVRRAVRLGINSILVSDIGSLQLIAKMRGQEGIPADLILKTSVMMAPCNPASAKILEDLQRGVELGLKSVLVSDLGVLQVVGKMKIAGDLPADLIVKTSVMMAPANPVSAKILEDLGATTINIPSDLSIPQIAGIRMAIKAPIDFYVEAPDNIGGFLRYYEIPELIRVAAPIYLKFGLRNSPDVYPSGTHIENTVIALSKERVRRAAIAMETIARYCPNAIMSPAPVPAK